MAAGVRLRLERACGEGEQGEEQEVAIPDDATGAQLERAIRTAFGMPGWAEFDLARGGVWLPLTRSVLKEAAEGQKDNPSSSGPVSVIPGHFSPMLVTLTLTRTCRSVQAGARARVAVFKDTTTEQLDEAVRTCFDIPDSCQYTIRFRGAACSPSASLFHLASSEQERSPSSRPLAVEPLLQPDPTSRLSHLIHNLQSRPAILLSSLSALERYFSGGRMRPMGVSLLGLASWAIAGNRGGVPSRVERTLTVASLGCLASYALERINTAPTRGVASAWCFLLAFFLVAILGYGMFAPARRT